MNGADSAAAARGCRELVCCCCRETAFSRYFQKHSCDLYRCGACGLIMVWPVPRESEIYCESYFKGGKDGFGYADYDEDKRAMEDTFVAFLERIEEYTPGRGKLLDVGAATGYFLDLARKRGWQPVGVELSPWAVSEAREKGLEVFAGELGDAPFAAGSFSAITLFDVIEHTGDPGRTLAAACALLKKNGTIAINTPDTSSITARLLGRRWHLFTPPEHLFYFNRRNLSLLLKDLGFEVLKIESIGKKFTLQYVAQFIGFNILSGTRLGRLAVPINLRDNMFLIARKAV